MCVFVCVCVCLVDPDHHPANAPVDKAPRLALTAYSTPPPQVPDESEENDVPLIILTYHLEGCSNYCSKLSMYRYSTKYHNYG